MKKYITVLMSLMIVSMMQLNASWRKPATTAAAAASSALAGYYGLNQDQQIAASAINVPANQALYPKFKDSRLSVAQSASTDLSSTTKNLESVSSLVDVSKKIKLEKMEEYTERLNMASSYFHSKSVEISSREILFIVKLTEGLSRKQFANFVDRLIEYVGSLDVEIEDVIRIYYHMFDYDPSRNIPDADIETNEELFNEYVGHELASAVLESHREQRDELRTAIHESGHALMTALLFETHKIIYACIIPERESEGHCLRRRSDVNKKYDAWFTQWADYCKGGIQIGLSGGIAMSMMEDQELTFSEFLLKAKKYGIGGRDQQGSDLYNAYQNAKEIVLQYYFDWWTMSSEEVERKINALVEQNYYEARDILSAHKDRLVLIRDDLYKNKVLPRHRLEEFVDSSKY